MHLFPGYGGASHLEKSVKVVRLLRKGCVNRPFFHIAVQEHFKEVTDPVIEQIGSYDPYPNKYNEKLLAINFQRLHHWIKADAVISVSVYALLGLAGYFPVHPNTYERAWNNRVKITKLIEELKITAAELENLKQPKSASLDSEESSDSSESDSSDSSSDEASNSNSSGTTQDSTETK